jgi:hypothetical protein
VTTPSLRCRSVTGWPHHLIPQLCRVPASTGRSPKPLRPGAAPGRHALLTLWGCGSTRKAPALQAVLCGSVTRHLHHFYWELPRLADCKSAVKKPVGRRPVEHYHQLPPFITPTPWVPKPKSSRRTVVNRVTNECESRRNRACGGQYFQIAKKAAVRSTLGHEEDSQSAPLGTARHPERNRGARPLSLPVAQEQSV